MSAAATEFSSIVRLEGVQKYFGAVHALRDIDIAIGRNEIVGLIGDNGAGKSTLIKVLTGVLRADSGQDLRPRPRNPAERLFGSHGARSVDRDRLSGQVAGGEAAAVAQFLRRPADHQPLRLHRHQAREGGRATDPARRHRLSRRRHHGRFDRRQPVRRRAPGHRDRPGDALQRRPHRARRTDRRARRRGSAKSHRLRAQDQTVRPRLHLYRAQSGACARGRGPPGRARPRADRVARSIRRT